MSHSPQSMESGAHSRDPFWELASNQSLGSVLSPGADRATVQAPNSCAHGSWRRSLRGRDFLQILQNVERRRTRREAAVHATASSPSTGRGLQLCLIAPARVLKSRVFPDSSHPQGLVCVTQGDTLAGCLDPTPLCW